MTARQKRVQMRLGHLEMQRLDDVVSALMAIADQLDTGDKHPNELFVVLSELFNNALDHGLLKLDSRLKAEPDGMEKYYSLRQERLQSLEGGEIEFCLQQLANDQHGSLKVQCRDSGDGYNVAQKMASRAVTDDLPYGRGLLLLQSMARRISHNHAGNEVTVII